MIIEVLYVVIMLLWALSIIPHPALAAWEKGAGLLAFVAVLLLGIFIFVPGLR